MTWIEFFSLRISHIYFVYGLAFFVLGLAVALEVWRTEPNLFKQVMWPLAIFGLVHGTHEWIEMFAIISQRTYGFQSSSGFETFRLVFLAVSFVALVVFGTQRLPPFNRLRYPSLWIGLAGLLLYSLGVILLGQWLTWQQAVWLAAADVLARYGLALPGAILATWVLLDQRQRFLSLHQPAFANDLLWAAIAFLLYGMIGQFFVGASPIFPSNILNAATFQDWFVIPIELFRGIMAVIIAIFIIRALRAFEYGRQQTLAAARQRVEEEIAQRDALRREFLHRIVDMQEEERTRIARELHDELGQLLTGLAIGLRGTQTSIDKPDLLRQQLSQLEEMAVQALSDMRYLVNELRPALLDDMGLAAALRHYKDNFATLTGVQTSLTIGESYQRLPGEIETILFRTTQEALTNIARHAQAPHAWIDLRCNDNYAILQIRDDGRGFDPEALLDGSKQTGWGLMGIQERVHLVDGNLQINSETGQGTTLIIKVPANNGRRA
jgi:signal transduction histidine kinase